MKYRIAQVYADRAGRFLFQDDPAQAMTFFAAALNSDRTNQQSLDGLAGCFLQAGMPHQGLLLLRKAVKHHPCVSSNYTCLGTVYLAQRQFKKAAECFYKAKANRKDHSVLNYLIGLVYRKWSGDFEDEDALCMVRAAMDCQDLAILANPQLWRAWSEKAKLLLVLENFSEAEAILKGLVEVTPKDISVRAALGSIFLKRQKYFLALNEFDAVLAIDPTNQEALQNRLEAFANFARFN
jgi:tetratricopeptide (TPR) repeat protein